MTTHPDDLREKWLYLMDARHPAIPLWLDPLGTVTTYRGRTIDAHWPDVETMRRDIHALERRDEQRKDVSSDRTFEGWIACADGRTLWEYATNTRIQ